MDKKTRDILIALAILFLLYYVFVYVKKIPTKKKSGNGNGNGNGNNTKKKYRCDAGGCLECGEDIDHASCVSLEKCQEQCSTQIQDPVILEENKVIGCMDSMQINYDPNANVPCNKCCVPAIMGCNDPSALNYYSAVTQGWGCYGKDPNNRDCCVYLSQIQT